MTQAPVHIENQYQLFSLFQAELLQFPLIHCRRLCRPQQCLFETCLWLHFSLSSYQCNECAYKMADKYHLRLPINAIKKFQWTFKKTLILPLKVVFREGYYHAGRLMWPCSSLFAPSFTKLKIITVMKFVMPGDINITPNLMLFKQSHWCPIKSCQGYFIWSVWKGKYVSITKNIRPHQVTIGEFFTFKPCMHWMNKCK